MMNSKLMKMAVLGLIFSAGAQMLSAADETPNLKGQPVDWYRFSDFTTMPDLQNGKALYDGKNTVGGASWCGGTEAPASLTFRFPKPITVEAFSFTQGGNSVTKYKVMADMKGDGVFDTVVAEREDEKPVIGKQIVLMINKSKVYGLKFVAIAGNSGYRAPYPTLKEIRIYSPDKIELTAEKQEAKAPQMGLGPVVPMPNLAAKRNIDIRVCIDTWSAGLTPSSEKKRAVPPSDFMEYKPIQNLVSTLKDTDANSVRLFIESPCCSDELPWKNEQLWPGHGDDYLKGLSDALMKQGNFKLYLFSHAWMSPFQKRGERVAMPYCRWDYPYEQSDRLVTSMPEIYKVKYPCVISDNDFREKWTGMMKSALDNGAAGIYLMPDEYYFKGHDLRHADCPSCRAEFKKMYGYDSMPKKPEDTEHYRKWKLFEYQKLSDVFDYTATELRKYKPDAQLIKCDNQAATEGGGRLEHTVASDVIWKNRNLADLAQVYGSEFIEHYNNAISFTKKFEATAGKDKLLGNIQWLGVSHVSPDYGIWLYGYGLPQVILGARTFEHYRHSYMQQNGWWENARELHKMIRILENWNIETTQVPETTCLLLSRASEDWWSIKERALISKENQSVAFYLHLAGDDVNKRKRMSGENEQDVMHQQNEVRGTGVRHVMDNVLTKNGIPYKILYTDRTDTLKNLKRFKLLVIPFSYSMSKEAFAEIKQAVDAGTKLIIFDQLAPTNEFGTAYEKPLLQELIGQKNVTYVPETPAGNGSNARKLDEYAKLFNGAIADTGYRFVPNDKPVSYLVVEYPKDAGYILYLGNWSRTEKACPVISLPAAKGNWKAVSYSPVREEMNRMLIDGKDVFTEENLKNFSVELQPGEVKLIRITR